MDSVTEDQNAFGRLLQAYLDGDDGLEIVERDDGFVGVAGRASAYFTPERAWPAHERAALAWARGRVLDIGCGAGRHGLALQERGLAVVGVDTSPRAIAVCTRRGLREARVLDVARLSPDAGLGAFDTLLLLGANLGLLGSAAGARTLLGRLHAVTSARARIIAESRDPAAMSAPAHAAYRAANRRQGRLPGQLRLRIRYRQYVTPWFDYLFIARGELERLTGGDGVARDGVRAGGGGRVHCSDREGGHGRVAGPRVTAAMERRADATATRALPGGLRRNPFTGVSNEGLVRHAQPIAGAERGGLDSYYLSPF